MKTGWRKALLTGIVVLVGLGDAHRAAEDQSITPVNAGLAHALIEDINISPGDQTDPHISGNLVSYTDFGFGAGTIRYYDLLTGIDSPIPIDDSVNDTLSSVDGTRHCLFQDTCRPDPNHALRYGHEQLH